MSRSVTSALRLSARFHHSSCLSRQIRYRPHLSSTGQVQTIETKRYASSLLNDLEEAKSNKGLRISHLFGGLVGLGMLVTIYGLLEYYFSLNTWPPAIRTPLRSALKARNSGDYERSEKHFREAIAISLSLPPSTLDPEPYLKLTGIYIELAALLESQGQVVKAYLELLKARQLLVEADRNTSNELSTDNAENPNSTPTGNSWNRAGRVETREERVRSIGLLQKIGHLSLQIASLPSPPIFPSAALSEIITPSSKSLKPNIQSWDASAEYYLNSAMTELLSLGRGKDLRGLTTNLGDLDLPPPSTTQLDQGGGGVNIRGIGITLEALAEIYARKGDYQAAVGCLLQAVDTLVPPKKGEAGSNPSIEDICQAAMLMTTISSHLSQPRTPDAIKRSRSFAIQSLEMADQAIQEGQGSTSSTTVCQTAKCVGLYNLGMLAEMQADLPNAMKYFTKSLGVARETGFSEGKRQANEAIRRIKGMGGVSSISNN